MTIEEYAKKLDLPNIKEIKINIDGKKITVYRLTNPKNAGKKIGLPFFAIPTIGGFERATPQQTIKINSYLYRNDE